MDFTRPERCRRQRTGREDRRSKFYEIPDNLDHGACVMELVSMLAGEPFGDRPRAVCPIVGAFLRAYNDELDDVRRQDLYELAAVVVGTGGDRRASRERARRCRTLLGELGGRRTILYSGRQATVTCARALLARGEHARALQMVRELAGVGRTEIPAMPLVDAVRA